ncbi:MAG: glycogen synthase [Oscillospiraceae bacterium]|jgi:starch synthase|nr:glycogen synthase [Oscillospiraceae bacterium]
MKILFASSEAQPFKASGGLAEVVGSLPKALRKRLVGARVVMPLYDSIAQELKDSMTFLCSIIVPVAWRRQYCGIFEARSNGVIYYLLDNQYYFKRANGIYGYYDDAERFAFFSRAVLEMLPCLDGYHPDVIHCNDWQTALVPVYQTVFYAKAPAYQGIRTLFTIHNIEYQGKYGMDILTDVFGLDASHASLLEFGGDINLMKAGIECADAVNTVSPSYAAELLEGRNAHGLTPIIAQRSAKFSGILNGIDTEVYDPAVDANIAANFSAESLMGKARCKAALQELFALEQDSDVPLIAMITRLASHKGIDIVMQKLDHLLQTSNMQFAVIGSGEWRYESFFGELAKRFPGRVGAYIGYDQQLSHKLYAACDMFLMPSVSEPCGLSQMIALRYGGVPIVHETGGLRDSIRDSGDGEGNGFSFAEQTPEALDATVRRALQGYENKAGWQTLVARCMACDFSWGQSANAYIRLYKSIIR